MKTTPYFEIEKDDEPGFFGLANDVWAEADARRDELVSQYGEGLGRWLADIRQYGAAWWGDAFQDEARRAENHMAFRQIGDYGFWDPTSDGLLPRWENDQWLRKLGRFPQTS